MTLTAIILLILLGLVLVILEILVLPGIVIGVIGAGLILFGITSSYRYYNASTGNTILLGTILLSTLLIYLVFRSNTWKKLTLNSSIDGKVNTLDENLIKAGDKGVTVSKVGSIGKASINDIQVEVESLNGFISENTEIIVVKITQGKILVKAVK